MPLSSSGSESPECLLDYSRPDVVDGLREALGGMAALRDELSDTELAKRVGGVERLYERSLGLAVVPTLLVRAFSRSRARSRSAACAVIPVVVAETKAQLLRGGSQRKMVLYERTLGLAVMPTLIRRTVLRTRMRGAPGGPR